MKNSGKRPLKRRANRRSSSLPVDVSISSKSSKRRVPSFDRLSTSCWHNVPASFVDDYFRSSPFFYDSFHKCFMLLDSREFSDFWNVLWDSYRTKCWCDSTRTSVLLCCLKVLSSFLKLRGILLGSFKDAIGTLASFFFVILDDIFQ